jgi:hypothetical protein
VLGLSLTACDRIENKVRGLAGETRSSEKKKTDRSIVATKSPAPETKSQAPETKSQPAETKSQPAEHVSSSTLQVTPPAELPEALAGPAVATKSDSSEVNFVEDPLAPNTALRPNVVAYKAQGWRDPFLSLISEDADRSNTGKVDLSVVKLVAIVMGEGQLFCVVEDAEGMSTILREGDSVRNGKILRIGPTSITASQTILGYTTQVQLELIDKKDVKHG